MKKDINYFLDVNGIFFTFNYIERGANTLKFNTFDHYICSLDLFVSRLVFDRKINNLYVFKIVPVGGASDGK